MSGAKAEAEKAMESPWLEPFHDQMAGVHCFSQSMLTANINFKVGGQAGSADYKLLVAHAGAAGAMGSRVKMVVYTGRLDTIKEYPMVDSMQPVAMKSFYADKKMDSTPLIAVASGPFIWIYRNMRPYFKFQVPEVEIDRDEKDVWEALAAGKSTAMAAHEKLSDFRDKGTMLSSQSLDLVSLDPDQHATAIEGFCANHSKKEVKQHTVITCMDTINYQMEDDEAESCLVVGTESKHVYILEPKGQEILCRVKLQSVPCFMVTSGMVKVGYRIHVCCRDGNVYTIRPKTRKDNAAGGDAHEMEVTGFVIELEAQPCGIVRIDKSIIVGCMGNVCHSYFKKGTKKNYSIYLPAPITNMTHMKSKEHNFQGLLLALANGEVRLYDEKNLIHTIHTGDVVTGMYFGPYNREESALVLSFRSGALNVRFLKSSRAFKLTKATDAPGPPKEQDVPLNVPKKTKLYVEQTHREREQATDMHRIFQRDLCKLRLTTAQSYVKIISDGQGPMSYIAGSTVRLNAQVQGLGPLFKLKLSVQNTGQAAMMNTPMTFSYNQQLYQIKEPLITMPLLIPGQLYKFEVSVNCVDQNGGADPIRVFVCTPGSTVPSISAVVTMPMCEPLLE